jgi:hypothetical protein
MHGQRVFAYFVQILKKQGIIFPDIKISATEGYI